MKKRLFSFLLCMILLLTVSCGANTSQEASQDQGHAENSVELIVYSGAGLKKSMEELKSDFENDNSGCTLNIIYAGSGQILAQLEESGKGDVFIVGSKPTFDAAAEKGLTNEGKPVAHHTPCIVTAKGNPLNIQTLDDLQKDDVKLALGEPESNAIGKTSVKIFEKNGLAGLEDRAVVLTATVNELYLAIESGNANAAIVTKDGAFDNADTVEIIDIPKDQNIDQIITGSTLKASENLDIAEKFIDYITSDAAKEKWEKHGFGTLE